MPFLDPATGHLNMKVAFYGPDAKENARRLREAHARANREDAEVVLRKVHGDDRVLPIGATVLFFDAPLGISLFDHALHLHLFALDGEPRAEHLPLLLTGVDGVIFVAGDDATTPIATLENLRAYLRQANHALPTVVVSALPEPEHLTVDRVVAAIVEVFREHLIDA